MCSFGLWTENQFLYNVQFATQIHNLRKQPASTIFQTCNIAAPLSVFLKSLQREKEKMRQTGNQPIGITSPFNTPIGTKKCGGCCSRNISDTHLRRRSICEQRIRNENDNSNSFGSLRIIEKYHIQINIPRHIQLIQFLDDYKAMFLSHQQYVDLGAEQSGLLHLQNQPFNTVKVVPNWKIIII